MGKPYVVVVLVFAVEYPLFFGKSRAEKSDRK